MPEFIIGQQSSGGQPGDIITSAAATRIGCILCDGSAVSRTTFSALFTAIGTAYGSGDGSTTFNLPDFRGRVVIGAGTGAGLSARARGNTGGEETHQLLVGELASHSHTASDTGHDHGATDSGHSHPMHNAAINPSDGAWAVLSGVSSSGSGFPKAAFNNNFAGGAEGSTYNGNAVISIAQGHAIISVGNNGSNTPHNNMQPYGVCNVFIHT